MPSFRNAREFLVAALASYRELQSYSDVGVVRARQGTRAPSCWFETDFVRPSQFRFQFIRPHPHRRLWNYRLTKYIAGSDGTSAYFYTEERGYKPTVEPESSLDMAVAGATGISQGTAHTIAALLLPTAGGFELSMLRKVRFRASRQFDGVPCTVVSGLHPWGGGRYTAWFGANDLRLKKLIRHGRRNEEVRFNIRTNEAIPHARFAPPTGEA
jgi:hypothetical protein